MARTFVSFRANVIVRYAARIENCVLVSDVRITDEARHGRARRPASAKATAARRSFSEGGSGRGNGDPASDGDGGSGGAKPPGLVGAEYLARESRWPPQLYRGWLWGRVWSWPQCRDHVELIRLKEIVIGMKMDEDDCC